MNISNLILQLQSKISDSTLDQQALTKAIKLLQVGAVYTVSNIAQLPTVSLNAGKLFYVEYDGLYYSDGVVWIPIAREPSMIYSWGFTGGGQLGDGFVINRSSPVIVAGGFSDWCQVSAGQCHSLGLRSDGTVWAWGAGTCGVLGSGTTTNRSSPVSVVGGFTDWCQVSAGGCHSLGVRQNGTAWAWGSNGTGRLGDNTVTNRSSPVSVVGGFTDWCRVSGGSSHSLGVRQDGTAWAWGLNGNGQLGDATVVSKMSPVSVVGGFTDWCQVSAGNIHSLGVRQDGTAWAWGSNSSGRLGDGTIVAKASPVSVVGGFTDWCQVSAGNSHSLGVRQNGTVWAWGYAVGGLLGTGNNPLSCISPASVVGGFTDWCQVSAGGFHSLGLRSNGTVWSWGCGSCGVLGDETLITKSSPVSVVGGFTDWCQISAGTQHSAAVRKK